MISILSHTLLILAVVALWTAAMADITRHGRRGAFRSVGMAAAVSAVAVIALAGIGAVFAGQHLEAVPGADLPGDTYLFSFGLEHASGVTPASPAGTK